MCYELDQRLRESSFHIKNLSLCDVRLKNHADHLWIILIPRVSASITEIYELPIDHQHTLMQEISKVSEIIKKYGHANKLNIGALGNMVLQLHIHIISRHHNDPLWPQSLWQSAFLEKPYNPDKKEKIIAELRELLS
ncbi:MAG: HIT domain-containing protein [Coxiellaceae bacterium]|nr:HIT domain-containing protein [Coxiellaceae bacterium]